MTPIESGAPDTLPEPATDARWELGRRFVLRAAGLPVETVHGLRCPGTRRWADTVLDEEERLTAAGAALSDLLHTLVKSTTGPEEDPGDAAARRPGVHKRRAFLKNTRAAPPPPPPPPPPR
ncbi:hypothetical protein ACFWHX_31895, partial [Streptomyces hirsutus]